MFTELSYVFVNIIHFHLIKHVISFRKVSVKYRPSIFWLKVTGFNKYNMIKLLAFESDYRNINKITLCFTPLNYMPNFRQNTLIFMKESIEYFVIYSNQFESQKEEWHWLGIRCCVLTVYDR